jgi:hypothetical protein
MSHTSQVNELAQKCGVAVTYTCTAAKGLQFICTATVSDRPNEIFTSKPANSKKEARCGVSKILLSQVFNIGVLCVKCEKIGNNYSLFNTQANRYELCCLNCHYNYRLKWHIEYVSAQIKTTSNWTLDLNFIDRQTWIDRHDDVTVV